MKEFINNYKDVIIPCLAGALLFSILLGGNLLAEVGVQGKAQMETRDYTAYQDREIFQSVCNRKKPIISCNAKKNWTAGMQIPISEAFLATDQDGNALLTRVLDIKDASGNCVIENYQEATHMVSFAHSGIYLFHLTTADREHKAVTQQIALVIDN
ncbi:MAG: hypothetical protein RSF88_06170 [Lachnospiraceae bacterium]